MVGVISSNHFLFIARSEYTFMTKLLFKPIRAKSKFSGDGAPWVAWRVKTPSRSSPRSVVGNTWYKAIFERWMEVDGEYENNDNYGLQIRIRNLKIVASPFHVAVSKALVNKIRPYNRDNDLILFSSLSSLPLADVVKIMKGDVEFIQQLSLSSTEEKLQQALSKLALDLDVNDIDPQPNRYGALIKSGEWWRLLCWGCLLALPIGDIVSIFCGSNPLSSDIIKDNPYAIIPLRKSFFDITDYIGWVDWIDWVARFTKRDTYNNRLDAMLVSLLLKKCWDMKSLYVTKKELESTFSRPSEDFYIESFDYSKITFKDFNDSLNRIHKQKAVEIERDRVYPFQDFLCEIQSAQLLLNRQADPLPEKEITSIVHTAIKATKKELGVELTAKQQAAVELPFKYPIAILSGLPGTGKTTTGRAIVQACKLAGYLVDIVTPTGIAAKNAALSMGHSAATIHRYFGWSGGKFSYSRRLGGTLKRPHLLIVDEISMVGMNLLHAIVDGVSENTRLLFIGDPEQIPSIAPGNTFIELLKPNLPRVHLSEIHRQAKSSGIIRLAHDISASDEFGKRLKPLNDYAPEVNYRHVSGADSFHREMLDCLPPPGSDPSTFQIIAPTREGKLGIEVLNKKVAYQLNPGPRSYNDFRDGDKVVITKNNYELKLWNGDIGILQNMSATGAELYVFGDSYPTIIPRSVIADELELAYAITIHKAQGSEFDQVIQIVNPYQKKYVYKNLMYTAVTRAKKELVILGDEFDFRQLALKPDPVNRRTQFGRWVEKIRLGEPIPEVRE